MLFRHSVGTYLGNELTRKSPGNTWPQSSQLAETLWTDPGLSNGIVVRELIFNQKKKKASVGGERIVERSPKVLAYKEKNTQKTPTPIPPPQSSTLLGSSCSPQTRRLPLPRTKVFQLPDHFR